MVSHSDRGHESPPSEVESGGFTYSKDKGIRYKGHHPKSVAELRLLYRKNAAWAPGHADRSRRMTRHSPGLARRLTKRPLTTRTGS